MRVLFVSPVGSFFSGAEVAIANVMARLVAEGHQVYNVISDNDPHSDQAYLDFMRDKGIRLYRLKTKEWWWPQAHLQVEEDKVSVFASQHQNITQVRDLLRSEQIELVLSNTVNVFQGAIAAALEGIPHYQLIHEFPIGDFAYYKEKLALIDALSDKVFAVSGALYDELRPHFSSDKLMSFVPYSNVAVSELAPSDTPRLVSIGGISPWKNQMELLQAYSQLEQNNQLELVLIGTWEEAYKKECDAFIAQEGLDRVSFLGHQTRPWECVREQDIIVLPSKVETFGLVYIEAILHASPVIAADNQGYQSIQTIFGAGSLYPSGQVDLLKARIEEVLHDFEAHKQESRRLQMLARNLYRFEEATQVFVEAIDQLVYTPKSSLLGLDGLLGWHLEADVMEFLQQQKVVIYHSNEIPYYQTDTYPLKQKDQIEITVGQADYIRVDLKQVAGLYKKLQLKNQADGQVLIPVHLTGLQLSQGVLFLTHDPQVVFETANLHGQTLVLTYEKESLGLVDSEIKEFEKLKYQIQIYEGQVADLRGQLHTLTSSRRWKVATKISDFIHFFRRKQ